MKREVTYEVHRFVTKNLPEGEWWTIAEKLESVEKAKTFIKIVDKRVASENFKYQIVEVTTTRRVWGYGL
jgi:hypothetical protein